MNILLDIIQLVAVIILFILNIRQRNALRDKDLEINALSTELDNLKLASCRNDYKATELELKVNEEVISSLNKIQRNYQVYKSAFV